MRVRHTIYKMIEKSINFLFSLTQIETNLLSYRVLDVRVQEFSNFDSEEPSEMYVCRKIGKI